MQLPVDILENSEISNLKSVKFPCSPYAACLLYYGPGGFAQAESEPMENVYQDLQAHRLPVVVSIITEESSKGKTMAALRALVQNFMPLDPSETSEEKQLSNAIQGYLIMKDFEKYSATLNAELRWYYKTFTYFSRPNVPAKPETSFMHIRLSLLGYLAQSLFGTVAQTTQAMLSMLSPKPAAPSNSPVLPRRDKAFTLEQQNAYIKKLRAQSQSKDATIRGLQQARISIGRGESNPGSGRDSGRCRGGRRCGAGGGHGREKSDEASDP